MAEMPADELATKLTGGVILSELPTDIVDAVGRSLQPTDFVIPPLPNQLEPVVEQILPILFRPGGGDGVVAEISERTFLDEVRDALGIEALGKLVDRQAEKDAPVAMPAGA